MHDMIVTAHQRLDHGRQHRRGGERARIVADVAGRHQVHGRILIAGDDVAERGACRAPARQCLARCGSSEITDRLGEPNAMSTSATLASCASVRASEIAAWLVPTLRMRADHDDAAAVIAAMAHALGDLLHRADRDRRARHGAGRRRNRHQRRRIDASHRRARPCMGEGVTPIVRRRRRQQRAGDDEARRQARKPAKAAISTVGSFFGKAGLIAGLAREMMRASGRRGVDVFARGRFAVFGEIGFQQIALSLGVALKRAQFQVLPSRLRGDFLAESRLAVRVSTRSPAILASLSSCRASRSPSRRICAVNLGDLRLQFLDARMLVEQRGRLLGKLGAQRVALLDQPTHRFGIGDVGGTRSACRSG